MKDTELLVWVNNKRKRKRIAKTALVALVTICFLQQGLPEIKESIPEYGFSSIIHPVLGYLVVIGIVATLFPETPFEREVRTRAGLATSERRPDVR